MLFSATQLFLCYAHVNFQTSVVYWLRCAAFACAISGSGQLQSLTTWRYTYYFTVVNSLHWRFPRDRGIVQKAWSIRLRSSSQCFCIVQYDSFIHSHPLAYTDAHRVPSIKTGFCGQLVSLARVHCSHNQRCHNMPTMQLEPQKLMPL